MKTSNIILLNILITLALLSGFYYAINTYGTQFLTGIWDKNGVTKIINQKVIQENVSEYRKLSDTQSDLTAAISTVSPSVVHIAKSSDISTTLSGGIISSFQGGGSAIVLTSDGYLLTNKHVVSDLKAKYTAITAEGKKLNIINIWVDPTLDLAIVKVTLTTGKTEMDLQPAKFVNAGSTINMGQFAAFIGSSQISTEFINAMGIVNQKNIPTGSTGDSSTLLSYYSVDAAIAPGFSGGPAFDLQGNVIGITTAMLNGQQRGALILPLTKELIQTLLTTITSQSKINRTPLGVTALTLNTYKAQQMNLKKFSGQYIQRVSADSLAAKAGLQKGDIITHIGGNALVDDTPLSRYWLGYASGDKVEMTISRQDDTQKLSIIIP